MNTSVIRYRVADFLKCHAPFDALPEQRLIELASRGRVKFHETDEHIFQQGEAKKPWVWIIQQGKVELLHGSAGEHGNHLIDVLGEGDLLGLEQFLGDGSYLSSARTTGDVLVYALEAGAFQELAAQHPAVKRYLAAHFSVSGMGIGRSSWLDAEPPPLDFLAARSSSSASAGDSPCLEVPLTTRAAVTKMVETGAQTLTIGPGVTLTAPDLALFCDRNPAALLYEISLASSLAELKPLLQQVDRLILDALAQPSDVDDCARIATEIMAAAAATCLRFAHQDAVSAGIVAPSSRFCWLAFGTLARGEVLRLSTLRIGLIYEENPDEPAAALYFNAVAGYVEAWFQRCGWEDSTPEWPEGAHPCMPLSQWQRFFRETIRQPYEHELFARRELFDLRRLSGDSSLLAELTASIAKELASADILLPLLANDTLGNLPPLTVFRGLVLNTDGTERDTLDLAEFVIDPISDAARVFALRHPSKPVRTLERLEAASQFLPDHASVFRDAAEAFRIALFHKTVAGTPSIRPSTLGKLDQRVMKTAFASILRLLELTDSTFIPRT